MTVHQIETSMPAAELSEWYAHFHLANEEAKKERDRAKRRSRKL